MRKTKPAKKPAQPSRLTSEAMLTSDAEPPKMSVEWQVTPGNRQATYVFHSIGGVFGFLARHWREFVTSWDHTKTSVLSVEIRRVEREVRDEPCTVCKGTKRVNWGQPGRIGGKVGPCICTPEGRRNVMGR